MKLNNSKIVLVYLLIFISFILSNLNAQDKVETKIDTINLVVSEDVLTGANKVDAQAAMKLAMMDLTKENGYMNVTFESNFISSINELDGLIKKNKADLIGLFILDYLNIKNKLPLEPILLIQRENQPGMRYVVIARKESNINNLADLKTKTVHTIDTKEGNIVDMWFFVEMKKQKISEPQKIINSFLKVQKQSKRVFSVFLGNADACIVTESEFEAMCGLNPQLKTQLKIVSKSPPFLSHIFCKNKNSNKIGMDDALGNSKRLAQTENGNKLLKLFKTKKMTDYDISDSFEIEKLLRDYLSYQ